MRIKIQRFVIFLIFTLISSCEKSPYTLSKLKAKKIQVSENISEIDSIIEFIKPYREHINTTLDEPLAYTSKILSKSDGELNTAIGNLMADIIMDLSNPIFKSKTGKNIDFVLLNHGGIRSVISEGNITARTAYQVMPFENKVVVLEITTKKVEEMLHYLVERQRAHPVSNIQITLNNDYSLKNVLIQGKPLEQNRTYYVATSDYLANLGDNMLFFKDPVSLTDTGYGIRNQMIDYFKKKEIDTITPTVDNRFIKL